MAGNGNAVVMVGSVNVSPHYDALLAAVNDEGVGADKVRSVPI